MLTLACAGGATLSSAYFVVFLSRTNTVVSDLPPFIGATLGGIVTLDSGIAAWGQPSSLPTPSMGTWSPTVTYAAGDSVASSNYSIHTSAGAAIAPLTYRSLHGVNLGHDPDSYGGWWTCITTPPNATNSNFVPVPFGYALSPLPTRTTLAAAQWRGGLGHSLFWDAVPGPPGDVIQFLDLYIVLNYLAGSTIVRVESRPLNASVSTPPQQGIIINPGVNAQFQCWTTRGLTYPPTQLTLNSFQPKIVDGMQPNGTVGESYLSAIVASGGTTPYTYGIISGSLPPGVSLDPATGVISGTPTASGLFEFTAQVTDSTRATAQTTCAAPIACGGGATGAGNRFY